MDYSLNRMPGPALDTYETTLPWNSRPSLVAERTAAVQPEAGEMGLVAGSHDIVSGEASTRPAMATGHPASDVPVNGPTSVLNPIDGMPLAQDDYFYRNRMEALYTGRGYLIDYEV